MTPLRHLIQRHRIAAFIVLAWGISWAYWIPMAIRGDVVTPGGNVTHFPGLVGPLIAAFIVTAIADGGDAIRDLVGRMFRWRVPLRWYLVAATPFLMFLAAVALLAATGGETPTPAELGEFSGLPVLAFPLVVLLVLVFNMYGEEVGWRGFLTPQLLARHGPFVASLLVAITWVTWHAPSFLVIETYRDMGLAILPMMGIGVLAGSIVLTWAYVGSGGSILIVVLWHLALNFSSATTAGRGMPGAFVWTGIVLWSIAVGLSWLIASEPRTRPLATRLRDGSLTAVIRSPLGRFLHGMTVIQFRGRRSGRLLMTPVECVREGDRLVVLVSHPEKKQWWRNVQASPDVTVAVDGHDLVGRAIVHVGDDAEAGADLGTYVAHRPRVAKALGLPADRAVEPEALAAAARKAVSVRIELRPLQAG